MSYPPAPWKLQGYALYSLYWIDREKAAAFVPPELEIVTFLPGKTLGGVYLSSYQSGSVLEYNELIISPGFVRYQSKVGAWISHIYVDNQDSVAGGREIWGLPKEMAQFTLSSQGVRVTQDNCDLCHWSYQKSLFNFSSWWRQKITGDVLSILDSQIMLFSNQFIGRLGLTKGSLTIPKESPFAKLELNKPWFSIDFKALELIADKPTVIS